MIRYACLALPLALIACGPVPVQTAESQCMDEAMLAAGPRGEIRIGASGGSDRPTRGRLGAVVDISSDYLAGRDPEKVWQRCVFSRSGQMPTRSLSSISVADMPMRPGRMF